MIPMTVPMIQTPTDAKRAREIVASEKIARALPRTPQFVKDGTGLCRTVGDPDDFTNDETRGRAGREARERAKAVCRSCPFSDQCLAYYSATFATGVFGGEWLIGGKVKA